MKNLNTGGGDNVQFTMESSTSISRSHVATTMNLQSPQHVALLRASSSSTLPNNYVNGHHNLNNRNLNNVNQINVDNLNNTVNGSYSLPRGFKADKFEIPLPFGYHMDLDFLRFCSDELVSGETLDKLKDLRRARRQQRKTLEALMGIKQEQRDKKRRLKEEQNRSLSSPPLLKHSPVPPNHTSTLTVHHTPNTPDLLNHSDFMKDALTDFEQCLEGTIDPTKLTSFDLIHGSKEARAKFNTFPRGQSPPNAVSTPAGATGNAQAWNLMRQTSNSSLSSISTNSSALPYNTATSPISPEASFLLAGLPSSIPSFKHDSMETDSIASISSEMSASTLKNVREQMAKSLVKLKEYEKQVEAIPVMQVKLSVLKEEKRLLMLKLKQRELQLRRERGELGDDFLAPEDFFEGELDTDVEGEDLDAKYTRMSSHVKTRWVTPGPQRRARSESPFGKPGMVQPDEFLSVQKRNRSTSCGYSSDNPEAYHDRKYFEAEFSSRRMGRSPQKHNMSARSSPTERSEVSFYTNGGGSLGGKAVKEATPIKKRETRDASSNTDPETKPSSPKPSPPPKPTVLKRDRASNTDPPPRSPPPPRKVSHGTNTTAPRTFARSTGTTVTMEKIVTVDEMEAKIQEAVFKTEEEIMGCPLLQKAMAKVEEEALNGPSEDVKVEKSDAQCQVGDENLRPFVITVGLQCKIAEDQIPECATCLARTAAEESTTDRFLAAVGAADALKSTKSIGVGECKVIEDPPDPTQYREIGVCTEKWVEVIKASKQTDTEDFAYKDTESPRVADMFPEPAFEPEPDRIVLERRSSLRRSMGALPASPYFNRKASSSPSPSSPAGSRKPSSIPAKVITKSIGINTDKEPKPKKPVTKDAKVQNNVVTKNASTTAMILPVVEKVAVGGSPLTTPELEKPPVNLNLCDKCNKDIKQVAEGIIAGPPKSPAPRIEPPSPDMPWLSKIPRPVPENPDVYRLKAATSTGNLSSIDSRPRSPAVMQRSKSNLTPSVSRRVLSPKSNPLSPPPRGSVTGTPPPHPATPPIGSRRVSSPLARSHSPYSERKSLIPKLSPGTARKNPPSSLAVKSSSTDKGSSGPVSPSSAEMRSLIPRVVTPPALRKMYPKDQDKLATPDRNVVRKTTYTKAMAGVSNPDLEKGPTPTKDLGKASKIPTVSTQKTAFEAGVFEGED